MSVHSFPDPGGTLIVSSHTNPDSIQGKGLDELLQLNSHHRTGQVGTGQVGTGKEARLLSPVFECQIWPPGRLWGPDRMSCCFPSFVVRWTVNSSFSETVSSHQDTLLTNTHNEHGGWTQHGELMPWIGSEGQRSETVVCRTSYRSVLLVHLTGQLLQGGIQVVCDGFHLCLIQLYCPGKAAVVVHQLVAVPPQLGQVSPHSTQAPPKFLLLAAVVAPPLNHWGWRRNRLQSLSSYTVQTCAWFKGLTEGYHDDDCSQEDETKQSQQNLQACSRSHTDWSSWTQAVAIMHVGLLYTHTCVWGRRTDGQTDGQTGTCLVLLHHVFSPSLGNVVVINGRVSVVLVSVCSPRRLLHLLELSWNLPAQIWFGVEILHHTGVSLQPESTLVHDALAWRGLTIVQPWH